MAEVIEKSPRDPRIYASCVLSNALKCVLISDPDTEVAAASMNVHIGSIHESIPGLAHYLEHMLFMGTEKYPEENEFSNFLSANAGASNAFTDTEDTNFYFKVSPDQFHHALSIFSQFFISPMFNQDSLGRELKAIDSEFHKNLLDDNWRIQQIIQNNADKPVNHFGLGNSSTLSIEGIRDRIIEFYSSFYSSNLMSLVICGQESIEELKKWAEELFSPIVNKNVQLEKYGLPVFNNKMTITKVISVKDNKNLKLMWALPSVIQLFKVKPEGYIAHLLGHEGKNSLLSYLKHENLAEELSCCHQDPFSFCSYLSLDIKLTEKGYKNYSRVIEIVYFFIKVLQSHEPEFFIFHELQKIAEAQFLFKNKKDPYFYCQKLASRLANYPVNNLINGPEIYFEFDPAVIKQFLQYLDGSNLQVFLISKLHDKAEMTEEKYFGTLYKIEPFDTSLIEKIKSPSVDLSEIGLGLPKINPYIPENYNVLDLSQQKLVEKIFQDDKNTVFFKQDSKFSVDKVYGQLVIYCNSCSFYSDSHMFMLAKMWEKLLGEKIREEGYFADLAGLKHEVDVDNHGIRVSLNGFSQKYQAFYEYLVKAIVEYVPSESDFKLFEDLKHEYITTLSNCFFSKPTTQIQRIVYELNLVGGYFTQLEKVHALQDITLSDVIWFSSKWLKNVYFEWFIMGNISKSTVLALVQSCTEVFVQAKSPQFLKSSEFLILKCTKLRKTNKIFQSTLIDPANTNSAVICQYQIGPETLEHEFLIDLIENYIEEPCFDTLRTKEQLGYIVNSYSHKMRGILNFMVLVQSSTHYPSQVIEKIEDFLKNIRKEVKNITDKQFKKLKKATKENNLKKDLSLQEEYQRVKFEIDSAAYIFDRKQKMKEIMKKVEKEEFLEFFEKVFNEKARKLDICLVSQGMIEKDAEVLKAKNGFIDSFSYFKRSHSVWPQVYIRK